MLVQTAVNPFIHSALEDGKATPFRNGVVFIYCNYNGGINPNSLIFVYLLAACRCILTHINKLKSNNRSYYTYNVMLLLFTHMNSD